MKVTRTIKAAVKAIQEAGEPYFSYGSWNEEANRMTRLNDISNSTDIKFPCVFLLEKDDEEWIESEQSYEADLELYIIARQDPENKTAEFREYNLLPELRTIETNLLTSLKNKNIMYTDYGSGEMGAPENQLNLPVNVIILTIPARYQKSCLT